MWHLKYIDEKMENEYYKLLCENVKSEFAKYGIKISLTDKELKQILIAKPDKLYAMKNELKAKFSSMNKEEIKNIFDYKSFIVDKKDVSYKIAKLIGVNTCVYCNRQYIFTVDDDANNKHIARPEFDHYLSKSEYPFFALSLYNLIPSCHICNSNCKGTAKLDENLNPYLTENRDYFKFTYHIDKSGLPSSVQIKDIEKLNDNVKEFLETFKIQEIYNCHTNFELRELYNFATKYSCTYLQGILKNMKIDMQVSQEEAYRILFGTELLEDNDNKRPLSKFKRDILKELRVIK